MFLQIYLHPSGTISTTTPSEDSPGTLIERWCLHYCPSVTGLSLPLSPGGLSRSQMTRLSPLHVYKRLTLLIRSVYSYCRVLPAYKLYRTTTAYRSPPFLLKYKLHSTLPQRGDAVSARMQRFEFSPVETADAKLHLSVEYQPDSTVKVLGQTAVRLPRPPIINNYVRETEILENKGTTLLERDKSQGISSTAAVAAAAGGDTSLEPAPSAPAALLSGVSAGGSTPRRGWSSSFRLSPARIYEPPVYGHQQYPSPTPSYGTPGAGSGAVAMSFPISTPSGRESGITTADVAGHPPVSSHQNQAQLQRPQQQGDLSLNEGTTSPQTAHIIDGGDDLSGEKQSKEGRRVSSSPVAIPGSSPVHYRRQTHGFRSSGDLGALEKRGGGGGGGKEIKTSGAAVGNQSTRLEYAPEKPMSAPALSYMHHVSLNPAVATSSNIKTVDDNEETDEEEKKSRSIDTNLMISKDEDIATPSGAGFRDQHRRPLPTLTVKLNPSTYRDITNASSSPSSFSSYPVPSSPDLPFAFTPSARYSCSPASVASSGGGVRLHQNLSRPSPPSPNSTTHNNLSGKEIPAGIALMRRASWGTRSIRDTTAIGAPLGQGLTNAVGYSISPIRDTMLDSVLSSASTPRNLLYTNKIGSDVVLTSSKTAVAAGSSGGVTSKRDPLLLTFPSTPGHRIDTKGSTEGRAVAVAAAPAGARLPREDSEQLPFDFTADTSEEHSHNSSSNNSRGDVQVNKHWQEQGMEGSAIELKKGAPAAGRGLEGEVQPRFDVQSSAASIGAFMRLINDAQPLSGLAPIPIEVGMHQLEALKNKLSSGQRPQR